MGEIPFIIQQQYFWMQFLISFLVSLSASATFIFLLLWLLQPRLFISDRICYEEENGERFYFFKIVNKSWFSAYSLEFELQKKEPYVVDKSKVNHRTTKVDLSRNHLYTIPAYKKEKGYGDHAVLIRTWGNLEEDIDIANLEYVLFVSAKHGLSNLTKVTVQTFDTSNVFHKGQFKFGKNLGVC